MRTAPKKLSDVVGLDFFFLLGQSDTCIFACLDTLQQPSHIPPDGAHVLHSFQILLDLIRRIAMHLIPVLGGYHRHIADGEVLVELVKGRSGTAPAAGDHCRAQLAGHPASAGIEQPVEEGSDLSAGSGIVDRRTDHQGVGPGEFLADLVVFWN